jgi:hypothetical protein
MDNRSVGEVRLSRPEKVWRLEDRRGESTHFSEFSTMDARWQSTLIILTTVVAAYALAGRTLAADERDSAYAQVVRADAPVAWWRFSEVPDPCLVPPVRNELAGDDPAWLQGTVNGNVRLQAAGPHPSEYPDFEDDNAAADFRGGRNYIVVTDPGEGSALDFDNGDAITLEAWVRWDEPLKGGYPYIVGKGRTHNPETSVHNQKYSLRLATQGGGPFLSFFFCDAETPTEGNDLKDQGHRWASTAAVPSDGAWHHVAVTYVFGEPDSLQGYVDGEPVAGKWDMGGKTTKRPFVDNDQLWIGSAMQGSATFGGEIDEVAIYRTALTREQIRRHVTINLQASKYAIGKVQVEDVPEDRVRVEIVEGVPLERTWSFRMPEPQHLFDTDQFALTDMPKKYDGRGLIADRKVPWLLHLSTKIDVPAGAYDFVVRSLDATRLYVDGELVAETPFMDLRSDGHQELHPITEVPAGVLSIPVAHFEGSAHVELSAGPHVVSLYRLVGSKSAGARIGELVVGFARKGEPLRILGTQRQLPFTDEGWLAFLDGERERLRDLNQQQRFAVSTEEQKYWAHRHELAREMAPPAPLLPGLIDESGVFNDVDRFINARLEATGEKPMPLVDDSSFLRRLSLDATGVIPTLSQIQQLFADPPETRRARAVERFLNDPGWADHCVSYWQDVLAENPGLTKPELNNTGPFRWYLYESFLDNKPFDRFVTDLVLMEGSLYSGGPAGFAMASENDVPMAAKAHIVGEAFLAVEMKCARCHDAPYHDVTQEDLFSLAALLKRGPQKVPGTSSVPAAAQARVTVSLQPGAEVTPDWPFASLFHATFSHDPQRGASNEGHALIPDWVLRNPDDTRERLAATLTLPSNERFARVIVNRLWQRFLGRGLVEPVDDWEGKECSHPDLLDFLARELMTHGYDLKHVAGLILNSHTYQRVAAPGVTRDSETASLFAGPVRRRMTGEQIADSLYRAVGKPFDAEELTMDADGRRPDTTFLDLGTPHRAWEFAAVSNERDRPSMSLPVDQSMVDLLMAYGWRQQRQDPLTVRDEALTPLQPMVLANGTAANRGFDLTDDAELTALVLEDEPLDELVEKLYERILTRPPTSNERQVLVDLLAEGYADRIVAGPEAVPPRRIHRSPRTWSNHLHPDATDEALARIAEVDRGEAPSVRLSADWRQRAEDAVWALVNLPEFVFVP